MLITITVILSNTGVRLTCAVDSISPKASITGTLKATKGVIAGSVHVAVIHFSFTLINIY